jgi:hypothetical protein
VTGKKCTTFKIIEKDFTISNTDRETENNDIEGLETDMEDNQTRN